MLETRGLDVSYGSGNVLSDISLRVAGGEPACVLGKNGVGKTTLLRSLIGLTRPAKGSIELDGQRLDGLAPYEIARKGVAYVPQGNQLFPDLTVRENLLLAVNNSRTLADRCEEVFRYFPTLKDKFNVRAETLSGGQQKFVAIARGLITKPKVLLLDEPSEGIQPSVVQELGRVIKAIVAEERCILLLVEQNRSLAFRVAERAYIIDRGRIVAEGRPADLEAKGVVRQYLSF
ncbi:MAG: ABC transporter ATP-binding protein [Bacillota bacterium]|nr:MAG: ABC transporter ATP-binding protein [Bacillota bacterium]